MVFSHVSVDMTVITNAYTYTLSLNAFSTHSLYLCIYLLVCMIDFLHRPSATPSYTIFTVGYAVC